MQYQKINIYTTIIHQKSVPKAKHICIQPLSINESVPKAKHIYNHYPSCIVHPPHIKSKYQKASYIYKFIHHTMFMITIHCSSTIDQKSVPEDIIHQVHDPHGSHIVALSNLLSWRCCSITSGVDNSSMMKFSMWMNKLFLC
jgi:hypothetical protein